MSLLKAGLLLVTGAVIGGGAVCEVLRRREKSKTYEVTLIKGLTPNPDDVTECVVNGQLCTRSFKPFAMCVIRDFTMTVKMVDDGYLFIPKHADFETCMLIKECMEWNQLDDVIGQLGYTPAAFQMTRYNMGWKATRIPGYKSAPTESPVDAVVDTPVVEQVKETKSDLRRAQPLKA